MTLATIEPAHIDRAAVLQELGLRESDAAAQALLLVCDRYGLDPLLKHMVLIQRRPYITRDGYLSIAHRSGVLDGIEVVEQGDSGSHWTARVAVYRKDMSRPFVYDGRYPKNGGNKTYGPEMAVKTAEVAALRRAFNVTGVGAADERWDDPDEVIDVHVPAPVERVDRLKLAIAAAPLADETRVEFEAWCKANHRWVWSEESCELIAARLQQIGGGGDGAAGHLNGEQTSLEEASSGPSGEQGDTPPGAATPDGPTPNLDDETF